MPTKPCLSRIDEVIACWSRARTGADQREGLLGSRLSGCRPVAHDLVGNPGPFERQDGGAVRHGEDPGEEVLERRLAAASSRQPPQQAPGPKCLVGHHGGFCSQLQPGHPSRRGVSKWDPMAAWLEAPLPARPGLHARRLVAADLTVHGCVFTFEVGGISLQHGGRPAEDVNGVVGG